MSAIELVIFDMDGTLIDSSKDLVRSMSLLLHHQGYPAKTESEIKSNIGWGVRHFVKHSTPAMTDLELDQVVAKFRAIYWEHMLDSTTVFPGIHELLRLLNHKRLAVFTNKANEFTDVLLERLGIISAFSWVLSRSDVVNPKPDPEGILKIMNESGVTQRQSVLYVGDSGLDMVCGKRAGVLTCGVTYGNILPVEWLLRESPDYVVHTPLEIHELITKLDSAAKGKTNLKETPLSPLDH